MTDKTPRLEFPELHLMSREETTRIARAISHNLAAAAATWEPHDWSDFQ